VISLFHPAFLIVSTTRNFGNANANLREIWTCFGHRTASSGYYREIWSDRHHLLDGWRTRQPGQNSLMLRRVLCCLPFQTPNTQSWNMGRLKDLGSPSSFFLCSLSLSSPSHLVHSFFISSLFYPSSRCLLYLRPSATKAVQQSYQHKIPLLQPHRNIPS